MTRVRNRLPASANRTAKCTAGRPAHCFGLLPGTVFSAAGLFLFLLPALFLVAAEIRGAPRRVYPAPVTFETGKQPLREIHVSAGGDDDLGDGSLSMPYGSLDRAASGAGPGTAIRIHAGTYPVRFNVQDLAGTAEAPIWIGGAPGEARPVIEGGSEGLHLTRVRFLVIHGLEIRYTADNGINADDGGEYSNPEASHDLVFRDLLVHHVGGDGNQDCLKLSGINRYTVWNSEFAFCGGGGSGSGIDHVGCHHGRIAGNYFHDTSGNAVQAKGGSEDIEIRANRMVDCGERALNIGGSTGFAYFRPPLSATQPNFEARDIRVIANLIQGSIAPLAFVGAVESSAVHNTVIHPTNWLIRILQETVTTGGYTFSSCAGNRVVNNLFYFDRSDLSTYVNIGPDTSPSTFFFSHNLWYAYDNPARSQPVLPVSETGGISGQNPLLVDPAGGDGHLQSGSPAIGHGTPEAGVVFDMDGRWYNLPPSIGAFEGNELTPRLVYLPLLLWR